MANSLCYWGFTDRFEEHGLDPNEFHGGFGLLSMSGFKKPQYHAFRALFSLGEEMLSQGEDYIVARSPASGEIQVLCWNYVHYKESYAAGETGPLDFYERYNVFDVGRPLRFSIRLTGFSSGAYLAEKTVFNRSHGSVFDFWLKNGALGSLRSEQHEILRTQSLPKTGMEILEVSNACLFLEETIEPFGFTLIKLCSVDQSLHSKK
jgi:xylan 1,4-beta-xylosidase